ncbi:MAG: hypothetical protein M1418_02105, partial [Deltaproteobacteria bacterium]|nr:hypothetical protein [Deltaproteobacteria bacterium]
PAIVVNLAFAGRCRPGGPLLLPPREGFSAAWICSGASKAAEYQKNRDVTEKRLYIEALEKILPNVNKLILGENIKVDNTDLWFLKEGLSPKEMGEVKKP